MDTDGNGTLDREEILTGLTRLYGEEKAKMELERILKTFDDVDEENLQLDFS